MEVKHPMAFLQNGRERSQYAGQHIFSQLKTDFSVQSNVSAIAESLYLSRLQNTQNQQSVSSHPAE